MYLFITFYNGTKLTVTNVTAVDFDGETGKLRYKIDGYNFVFSQIRVKEVSF